MAATRQVVAVEKVLKVTKLTDDGSEGTLRWACNPGQCKNNRF